MTNPGKKDDGLGGTGTMKDRFDLIPADCKWYLAKVLTYGAQKYGDNNWQGVEEYRYWGGLDRHLNAHLRGEHVDSESGLPHLAMAYANLTFLLWKHLNPEIPVSQDPLVFTPKELDSISEILKPIDRLKKAMKEANEKIA